VKTINSLAYNVRALVVFVAIVVLATESGVAADLIVDVFDTGISLSNGAMIGIESGILLVLLLIMSMLLMWLDMSYKCFDESDASLYLARSSLIGAAIVNFVALIVEHMYMVIGLIAVAQLFQSILFRINYRLINMALDQDAYVYRFLLGILSWIVLLPVTVLTTWRVKSSVEEIDPSPRPTDNSFHFKHMTIVPVGYGDSSSSLPSRYYYVPVGGESEV
jgi:hypothetical protein